MKTKLKMRTVLVTGFEPFDGAEINPSLEIARNLHGTVIAGHTVVGALLPCVFGAALLELQRLLRMHRPTLVIGVGQAGGRAAITPERVALNVDDARIPDNVAELRAGKWNKKEYSKARGLLGQTLGLIGFGHIGQEVAVRARAFGMPVLVWSRRFTEDAAARTQAEQAFGVKVVVTAEELVAKSDILSVHLALTKDTRNFVNAELLAHARPVFSLTASARPLAMITVLPATSYAPYSKSG